MLVQVHAVWEPGRGAVRRAFHVWTPWAGPLIRTSPAGLRSSTSTATDPSNHEAILLHPLSTAAFSTRRGPDAPSFGARRSFLSGEQVLPAWQLHARLVGWAPNHLKRGLPTELTSHSDGLAAQRSAGAITNTVESPLPH